MTPAANPRRHMIENQILPGHVLGARVLEAMALVPREVFVPPARRFSAYVDEEIALGGGRYLMAPLTFARLLEHAELRTDETVLDVASATGYSAAVLAGVARKVVALESDAALAGQARALLASYPNVRLVEGAPAAGYVSAAPYDAILIEGAIQMLPQPLIDQLREGGRIVAVEHDAEARVGAAGLGKLVRYSKLRGRLTKTVLRDANGRLLAEFASAPAFAF